MDRQLLDRVLTLSVDYEPPRGGVAQVVKAYSDLYPVFHHVATTSPSSRLQKVLVLLRAFLVFLYYCLFRGIDLVHVHGASYNSFYRKKVFIRVAKLLGKKVVYHVHGAEFQEFYRLRKRQVERTMKDVDVLIALSDSWRRFFEDVVGHRNVRVVENVVARPQRVCCTRDDVVHFLFLGEIGKRKGVFDLVRALSEKRSLLIGKAVFHIGGAGEMDKLCQQVKRLGVGDMVVLEGWVSGNRKAELLSRADVYILPSYAEGLPISILEAMSYGLPIVCTPVGGIPEVVEHEKNGLLVDPGDIAAIGEAVLRMVEDREFRRSAGGASLLKVSPHFPERIKGKLESIYSELLG